MRSGNGSRGAVRVGVVDGARFNDGGGSSGLRFDGGYRAAQHIAKRDTPAMCARYVVPVMTPCNLRRVCAKWAARLRQAERP